MAPSARRSDSAISACALKPRPWICASPWGVQTATTFIWFSVRVPVLSVQMKVVAPRVSTDSSRRTSAFCPAIRWAPIASERVTVGSNPSGTSATVTPIPKMNPSEAGTPRASIRAKKTTPTAPAMSAMIRDEVRDVALQWRGRTQLQCEPGDATEPGGRPGGARQRRDPALDQEAAGEDLVACCDLARCTLPGQG